MNLIIRSFRKSDRDGVTQLWNECDLVVPWNNPQRDIERKLSVQPNLFLIGLIKDEIIATAMAGYDGHRGWVYYLAVKPKYQNNGFGKLIMEEVEKLLIKMGCPKIDIMVRKTNLDAINFYKSIDYDVDEVITMSKRLELDN